MRITNYSQALAALKQAPTIANIAEVEERVAQLGKADLIDQHQVVNFYGKCVVRKIQIIAESDSFASGDNDELEAAFQAARTA